jgi:UDP-N-acetyl-D-glucosamine/UDP-N-acetyl-D-galactosamine dehydrogenase
MTITEKTATVCVVGAGYVGLPIARVFSNSYKTISYDVDARKIEALAKKNGNADLAFTTNPGLIAEADFILICVPTPLTEGKRPDMSYIKSAAATIGLHLKKGAIVIVESSVYPGATEELFKPLLEETSGYVCGRDFKIAYSPERINPGDFEHSVDRVTKIVAACDEETLERVAELYRHVTPNIFKARNIRTAEAAKLVENTQRDINIALVNELSMIFQKMGIDTRDVLEAAGTKWNFQKMTPGMVGGYCIPVVPYFLVQKAHELGCHPQVIPAGRAVNDYVPKHIGEMTVKALNQAGKVIRGSKVLIMGCTYKENVADTRETPVRGIISELREYGADVYGYDPLVTDGEQVFGIKFIDSLATAPKMDAVVLTIVHDVFREISLARLTTILKAPPVLVDVRGFYASPEMEKLGIIYRCM